MNNMYPDNVLGLMFRMLDSLMSVCNFVTENLSLTVVETIDKLLAESSLPTWLANVLSKFADWNFALIGDITMFNLLLGGGLLIVIVVGIAKFVTDLVGL